MKKCIENIMKVKIFFNNGEIKTFNISDEKWKFEDYEDAYYFSKLNENSITHEILFKKDINKLIITSKNN